MRVGRYFGNGGSMKKTAFVLMAITILSKILGFGREMVLANYYGAGTITDAFIIAFTIPTLLFNFVSTGLMTGFIPMFTRIETEKGRPEALRFTSNLTNILLLIALAVFAFGMVFTPFVVKIFAFGFTGEKLELAVYFTRYMMVSVFAIAVSSVYRGYLNQHGNFVVPASTGFIMNVFTIAAIMLSAWYQNLMYLGIGAAFAQIIQYVAFVPAVRRTGYRHFRILDFSDPNVRSIVLMALPIIVGVAVQDVNRIVDNNLATLILEDGGVAILTFANRLVGFVSGIVIISITTAIYPILSRLAIQRDIPAMKTTFRESLSMMNILVMPSVVGLVLFSEPIVSLLFERGEFTAEAVRQTGMVLALYAPSLLGLAISNVLSRMFYALHDTRTPAVNAVITVIMNIVFSILFALFMGIRGLALGTTVATILGALLLLYILRVRMRGLSLKVLVGSTVKITIASLVMGAVSYAFYIYSAGFLGDSLRLLFAIAAAGLVYVVLILLLRVEEAHQLAGIIGRKFKRKG